MFINLIQSLLIGYLTIGVLLLVISSITMLLDLTATRPPNYVLFALFTIFFWGIAVTSKKFSDAFEKHRRNQ